MLAPSLSFCPALLVSAARSLPARSTSDSCTRTYIHTQFSVIAGPIPELLPAIVGPCSSLTPYQVNQRQLHVCIWSRTITHASMNGAVAADPRTGAMVMVSVGSRSYSRGFMHSDYADACLQHGSFFNQSDFCKKLPSKTQLEGQPRGPSNPASIGGA
eukprot:1159777-Pelagomonas_calceolata.AAC.8